MDVKKLMITTRSIFVGLVFFPFCFPTQVTASLLKPDNTDRLFNHQNQQQQAHQQQFEAKAPDVSLLAPITKTQLQFPPETPCFVIKQVSITGQEGLPHWVYEMLILDILNQDVPIIALTALLPLTLLYLETLRQHCQIQVTKGYHLVY